MAYTLNYVVTLMPYETGETLTAQAIDTTGADSGEPITTFVEVGNGHYMFQATLADDFRGAIKVTNVDGKVVACGAVNPEEVRL